MVPLRNRKPSGRATLLPRKSIRCYRKRAALRTIHPHVLRHTFATTCLQAGCDIKTLSELLGHANANVTLQRYVHS